MSTADQDPEAPSAARGGAWAEPGRLSPVLLSLGAYVLFRLALAFVRLPPHPPGWLLALGALVSAAGGIGLPIAIITALVRRRPSVPVALGIMVLGLALWLGLLWAVPLKGPRGWVTGVDAVQDVGKILAAAGAGVALAAGIREPNILLPAGLFAAFADFVVVTMGTVKHALSNPKGQALVQSVSAKVPTVHPALPALTIGPADFMFLGIFLACAVRFDMDVRRTALTLAGVLTLSLLLVPFVSALPALAPMSVAFVAVNWRRFRLTRDEILGSLLVLALMGGLFFVYFRFLFGAKHP